MFLKIAVGFKWLLWVAEVLFGYLESVLVPKKTAHCPNYFTFFSTAGKRIIKKNVEYQYTNNNDTHKRETQSQIKENTKLNKLTILNIPFPTKKNTFSE